MNPGDCEHVQEWNGCLDGGESSEKCNQSLAGEVRAKGWVKRCQPTVDARQRLISPDLFSCCKDHRQSTSWRSRTEAGMKRRRRVGRRRKPVCPVSARCPQSEGAIEGSVSPEGSRRRARTFSCHLRPHSCSQALLISAQHEEIGILLIGRW